jgi:hypothetical protein
MKSGSRWAGRISSTAVIVLALASVSVTVHAAVTRNGPETADRPTPSVNLVPFQYIAKAYTELLGRTPAASEWARAVQSWRPEGARPQYSSNSATPSWSRPNTATTTPVAMWAR